MADTLLYPANDTCSQVKQHVARVHYAIPFLPEEAVSCGGGSYPGFCSVSKRVPGIEPCRTGRLQEEGPPGGLIKLCGLLDQVLASLSALFSRPGEAANDDNDDGNVLAAALRPSAGLETGDSWTGWTGDIRTGR